LHFHDRLIEAIERDAAKAAGRAAEDNFKEIDVRARRFMNVCRHRFMGAQSASFPI
jgi:hypothetical protein